MEKIETNTAQEAGSSPLPYYASPCGRVTLYHGDCLDVLTKIQDASADMVMADPPYGTTACKWDSVIPFEPMWVQLRRITKPNGAITLTASQPFTSALVMSNVKMFKYEWIWGKNMPTGFAMSKFMPMKAHENICVFVQEGKPKFNKQPTKSLITDRALGGVQKRHLIKKDGIYGRLGNTEKYTLSQNVSPRSVIPIDCEPRSLGTLHPTQKPVALMEYMIRTYTNPCEVVIDFTMGSGTTGIACIRTGRKFIGIEKDPAHYATALKRIKNELAQGDLFLGQNTQPEGIL